MKQETTSPDSNEPLTISPADKRAIADELRVMLDELRRKYGTFSDSADVVREMRDERG